MLGVLAPAVRAAVKPRTPQFFLITPATHTATGKPCVVLNFGKLGQIALEADDVERLKAELDKQLQAAADMGTT
jgi:hypothetical protein